MIEADSLEQRLGGWRLETEGTDDDGDGRFNEDPRSGVEVDRNFPHAFPFPDPGAGPWPSYAPESKAVMDALLARPNIGLAVVFGPANNLLELPRATAQGGDLGTQEFKLPEFAAEMLGFDPEQEYTLDEVWEVARELPFVVRNRITKERLAQFLGAGPATELEEADSELLTHLAGEYKKRLDEAGLDSDRPARQYERGGLTPWLYYQYGALALELDVWGIPSAEKEEAEEALTVDRLEGMSSEELVALGEEAIATFLADIGAPPQFTAAMVVERVESGEVTPQMMAGMIRRMGGGAGAPVPGEDSAEVKRRREVLDWVAANAPGALTPWRPVTLPDGSPAEVGGLDPFIVVAPPFDLLEAALEVHTATVLDLATRMAEVELVSLEAEPLGSGVYRVRAVARNRGFLPTHTRMAERARAKLPVRLHLEVGEGAELVTGRETVTSERLEGTAGTLSGEWLLHAADGTAVTVEVLSDSAGTDRATVVVREGA